MQDAICDGDQRDKQHHVEHLIFESVEVGIEHDGCRQQRRGDDDGDDLFFI